MGNRGSRGYQRRFIESEYAACDLKGFPRGPMGVKGAPRSLGASEYVRGFSEGFMGL